MKVYERLQRRHRIHPYHQRHPLSPMAIRIPPFCIWQTTGFCHQSGQLSRLSTRLATPLNSPQPRPPRARAVGHYRRATSAAGVYRVRE